VRPRSKRDPKALLLSIILRKRLYGSVRNKVLQKLLLLKFLLIVGIPGYEEALRGPMERRLKEKGLPVNDSNLVYDLKPEDIMPLIGVSRRTALEYLQALRWLSG
jgi:hypothetical protein